MFCFFWIAGLVCLFSALLHPVTCLCFRETSQDWQGCPVTIRAAMEYLMRSMHNFSSKEARQLLHNKFVVIMGDSIHRSVYKDLVLFLRNDRYITEPELKRKGEMTFEEDSRVEFYGLHSGTDYREVREYHTDHHLVHYYFIPRVYSDYTEKVLDDLRLEPQPDVVIVNSCLWDLNRYLDASSNEPPLQKALQEYRKNLEIFLEKMNEALPQTCLRIWNTSPPIAKNPSAKGLFGMEKSSPEDVVSANFYSANAANSYEWDVLDFHCHFQHLVGHRTEDGIHWNNQGHRIITKLLLTHIADAWGVKLRKKKYRIGIAPAHFPPVFYLPPPGPHHSSFPGPPPVNDIPPQRFSDGSNLPFHDDGSHNNWPVHGNEPGGPNLGWPRPPGQQYFSHPGTFSNGPGGGYEHSTWFSEPQVPSSFSYGPPGHQNVVCSNRPEYSKGPLHPTVHHNGPMDQPKWEQGPSVLHGQFNPNDGPYSGCDEPAEGFEQGPSQLSLQEPCGPSNICSSGAYGEGPPPEFWYQPAPVSQYTEVITQSAFPPPERPVMPRRGYFRGRQNRFRPRPWHPYAAKNGPRGHPRNAR